MSEANKLFIFCCRSQTLQHRLWSKIEFC